jgi:hypothetical protein
MLGIVAVNVAESLRKKHTLKSMKTVADHYKN